MKESVDKRLKERIIEVFDHYEAPDADHGWMELRKKYPKKPSNRRLIWWSSVAAMLAITGGFWLLNSQPEAKNIAVIAKRSLEDTVINNLEPVSAEDSALTNSPVAATPDGQDVQINSSGNTGARGSVLIAATPQQPNASELNDAAANNFSAANISSVDAELIDTRITSRPGTPLTGRLLTAEAGDISKSSSPEAENMLTGNLSKIDSTNIHSPINQDKIRSGNDQSGTNLLTLDHSGTEISGAGTDAQKNIGGTERKHPKKTLEFSFYAGAFLNYAEGSSNSMNLGAGISSGVSLSEKFTLVAGVALAKNTLTFRNELPATSYVTFLNNAPADQKSANSFLARNIPQISKFEAQLLNLDIPVNLKYSLSREPGKVFITAGVSSFTYLNETYRYSYNNLNNGLTNLSTTRDEVINEHFGKVDLAQTLNFSFGLTHKGRFQSIVFEPFIKYPLATLGSQDIRFGSTGINLKLSIHKAKENQK